MEETWKSLEFTVIPHRDCKDVYILGRTEEIQQVLDDSFITINTIASSRYVGPIKMQVEKWLHQLELFSKALVSEYNFCYLKVCFLKDHNKGSKAPVTLGERSITKYTDRNSNLATAVSFSEYCLLLCCFLRTLLNDLFRMFLSLLNACSRVLLEKLVAP